VLYAKAKPAVLEQDWAALVQSIAAGDQLALHALYERAHRPVFTLIMRITSNRETAEELTLDVFHDIWRRASLYKAANGTVLGWIMNQARSRAIDRLRFESRKKRSNGGNMQPQAEVAADPSDVLELREQAREMVVASAIREEAIVADAMETVREDVQQKAADEPIGRDRHHLFSPSARAAEIGQHMARNRDEYHSSPSVNMLRLADRYSEHAIR
jgi:DNA-directed RNA polymerase specialized sigma24 family protein